MSHQECRVQVNHPHILSPVVELDSSILNTGIESDTPMSSEQPNVYAITDVDVFEYENILKQPTSSAGTCEGYTLTFQNGKSPHTTYPFGPHDTIVPPWDYALRNGVMKLFMRSCCGLSEGSSPACQACQQLAKNEKLEHILMRMEEEVHENTGFAYHGFSGL
jgi:hypothetical protein